MTDSTTVAGGDLAALFARIDVTASDLQRVADSFSRSMTYAFANAIVEGERFDEVLKGLAIRLSDLVLQLSLKPVENAMSGMLGSLLGGAGSSGQNSLFGAFASTTAKVTPFATGGVIATPTYFPMTAGHQGLAGEAGPEAILPLRRGADGRLGVSLEGSGSAPPVQVVIRTPDADSFRRSEAYVAGMVARAVRRGRRHE
jgi:lambda family phage tail tape measure protein